MDKTLLMAEAGVQPSPEDIAGLIQRATEFVSFVEGLVLQETKDWITEFQSSLAQLEKETKVQFDALKGQVEKAGAAQAAASLPGSVEIVVPNADKADNFTFRIVFENAQTKVPQESVSNAKEWVRIQVPPGQYTATISATAGGKQVVRRTVINIKPGEHTKQEIPLPI
jgi:flagellar hook assembly protein FlgD